MATISDVWRAVFPRAIPQGAPGSAARRQVKWVRVMRPRVPAFDALEPGDLAILPQPALRDLETIGPPSVVDAVARAGGVGVVVVGDDSEEPAAMEALDRAVRLGIGAFRLPEGDPAALERSVIGYLVDGDAEVERQAGRLETELERIGVSGGGLDDRVARIAGFLGRAVAVEDAAGTTLALHAPRDVPDAARAAAGYVVGNRRAALRTSLPASASGADGPVAGALVLLGPGSASELDRAVARRISALLALDLGRGSPNEIPAAPSARTPNPDLPTDGPPWVALVARQLGAGLEATVDERERLRDAIRRLAPRRRLVLRGDVTSLEIRVVAAADDREEPGMRLAARVASLLERPVALSRPFSTAEGRPHAEAEARATLETIERLRPIASVASPAHDEDSDAGGDAAPSTPVIARAELLPAYRLLAALHDLPEGIHHARALLGPVLAGRASRVRQRLATLRAVLDRPGLAEAAATLGIHRNTLSYRIARIEQMAGWRLDDPSVRFSVALAVRLVQSEQERNPNGP